MTDRYLMQQALEALENTTPLGFGLAADKNFYATITALRERLAQQEQEQEPVAWKNAAIRLGEELSSVGPDSYYDMNAEQWLDWAIEQRPHGKNSLPAQQEPVAWMFEDDEDDGHKTFRQTPPSPEAVSYLAKWKRPAWVPLYTHPQKRKWVGLTDEEIETIYADCSVWDKFEYERMLEAKLKEKNT